MGEFWKAFADVWPAIKDAIATAIGHLGLPGFLFGGVAMWLGFENRALKGRVEELSDKLIETGDKSTGTLIGVAKDRLDLLGQIEALNERIGKQAPKDREP
ncbi:MAG: hypothetical protein DI534_16340 [Leifsonia xyli]|nr:MAG: hypothetical protein DI534_16340 [Leifsonia xyli]